jgi:putative endonuclease
MPFWVYILRSSSAGRFYVGQTDDLTRRLFDHNNNRTVSIKNRGPWELVYSEQYAARAEAVRRERHIKRMKCSVWIEQLVAKASR